MRHNYKNMEFNDETKIRTLKGRFGTDNIAIMFHRIKRALIVFCTR